MDPLSIAGSVLSITTTCIKAAKALNDIRDAWKRAPVTVTSLCSQLKLTGASLSQIQSLLLNDTDILQEKPELIETFDTTLTSCLVLSRWLENIMQKITKGVLDDTKAPWKMKFKTVWNEGEIKELLQQLHTQQGAIGVLVGLLQMDSISEIKKIVRRHEALLEAIANNTRGLRHAHSIEAPESILASDEASGSIFSKLAKDHDTRDRKVEDSFESVVLTTKVYSKAFTGVLSNAPMEESDDVKTITNINVGPDEALSATESISNILRPTLPIQQFVTPSPSFDTAKENLRITEIYAYSGVEYEPEHTGELKLSWQIHINQIQKVNDYWYWGQTSSSSDGRHICTAEGLFARSKVKLLFELFRPIFVRTRAASRGKPSTNPGNSKYLRYDKDEILEVLHIPHSTTWRARRQTVARRRKQQSGWIYVDDLEVDANSLKDVDALLKFSSYPHPALVGASEEELQERIEKWFDRHIVEGDKWFQFFAHCSSFQELQAFTRIYRKLEHGA